jgi:hypothetical protein
MLWCGTPNGALGKPLRTMTEDEDLSLREAAVWCGGRVTVREITRLLQLQRG